MRGLVDGNLYRQRTKDGWARAWGAYVAGAVAVGVRASRSRPTTRPGRGFLVLATICVLGCDGPTTPGPQVIADFTIVSGDGQTGRVNTQLLSPLIVRVSDLEGDPVPGVSIAWTIESGDGAVSESLNRTRPNGEASVFWTLPSVPGPGGLRATIAESGAEDFTVVFGANVDL